MFTSMNTCFTQFTDTKHYGYNKYQTIDDLVLNEIVCCVGGEVTQGSKLQTSEANLPNRPFGG